MIQQRQDQRTVTDNLQTGVNQSHSSTGTEKEKLSLTKPDLFLLGKESQGIDLLTT